MYVDLIQNRLPEGERLAQLAEEAAELAQAALKLRRALDRGNPTPLCVSAARDALRGELADVLVCVRVLGLNGEADREDMDARQQDKLGRWAWRLIHAAGTEGPE